MKNKISILAFFIIFVFSFIFYSQFINPLMFSTDEARDFYSTKMILENNSLNFNNPLNNEYNTIIFQYDFTVIKDKNEVYPIGFAGTFLLYSIFFIIFGFNSFFFIPALFAALNAALIFAISRNILRFNLALSLATSFFLIITPLFFHWSIVFYSIQIVAFFILSGTYLISSNNINPNKKHCFLAGIMYGCALFINPPTILVVFSLIVYLMIRKKASLKYTTLILPILLTIITLLLVNYHFYNDPFFWPDAYSDNFPIGQNTNKDTSLFNKIIRVAAIYLTVDNNEINALISNFYVILSDFYFPFIIFSLLGLFYMLKDKNELGIFIFINLIIFLLFYGRGHQGYGSGTKTLQSTFLRYLMPIICFLPISFIYLIKKITRNNKSLSLIIIFLIVSSGIILSIDYSKNSKYGIEELNSLRNEITESKSDFLPFIPESSIVLVDRATERLLDGNKNLIFYPTIPNNLINNELRKINFTEEKVFVLGANYSGTKYKEQTENLVNTINKDFNVNLIKETKNYILYEIIENN